MDPLTLALMWFLSQKNGRGAAPVEEARRAPPAPPAHFDLPPFPGGDWSQLPEPLPADVEARMTALAVQLLPGQHKAEQHPSIGPIIYEHAGATTETTTEGDVEGEITTLTMRVWVPRKAAPAPGHPLTAQQALAVAKAAPGAKMVIRAAAAPPAKVVLKPGPAAKPRGKVTLKPAAKVSGRGAVAAVARPLPSRR